MIFRCHLQKQFVKSSLPHALQNKASSQSLFSLFPKQKQFSNLSEARQHFFPEMLIISAPSRFDIPSQNSQWSFKPLYEMEK